jgi:hypothetical protein
MDVPDAHDGRRGEEPRRRNRGCTPSGSGNGIIDSANRERANLINQDFVMDCKHSFGESSSSKDQNTCCNQKSTFPKYIYPGKFGKSGASTILDG